MKNVINEFRGEYRFLSNFYPAEVELDGLSYPTVEHAYQAAKTDNMLLRTMIRSSDCLRAKSIGRGVRLRRNWNDMKLEIMERLLRQKFAPGSILAQCLLDTGKAHLVEGNTWDDSYWGVCGGTGENHLGKLLMKIRRELQSKK